MSIQSGVFDLPAIGGQEPAPLPAWSEEPYDVVTRFDVLEQPAMDPFARDHIQACLESV